MFCSTFIFPLLTCTRCEQKRTLVKPVQKRIGMLQSNAAINAQTDTATPVVDFVANVQYRRRLLAGPTGRLERASDATRIQRARRSLRTDTAATASSGTTTALAPLTLAPPLSAAPIDLASPTWDARMKTALSRDESATVTATLAMGRTAVVVNAFSVQLRGEHVQCFRDRAWMNDESINMFFELLRERGERYAAARLASAAAGAAGGCAPTAAAIKSVVTSATVIEPRCIFFSSFFFFKLAGTLRGYQYTNVKLWTRRLKPSIFTAFDLVLIPLHVDSNHWVLAVIDMRSRLIQYWDSLSDAHGDDGAVHDRLQVRWRQSRPTKRIHVIFSFQFLSRPAICFRFSSRPCFAISSMRPTTRRQRRR